MGRSRRLRQIASKLGLAAATLLVSHLAVEGVLRLAGIGAAGRGSPWFAGGSHPRFLFQPDPAAGYTLRPGFRGMEIAASGEYRVPVAIDGSGLRDHQHAGPGIGGPVLAIGDSMTFGEGVEAGATYAALLERATGVRVYNGGVPGYSSRQMAARLARLAPLLRPRLVLVTLQPTWDEGRCRREPFVYRDGYIVTRSYLDRLYLVNGNLYAAQVRWPLVGPATAYLQGHSYLARLALPALHDLMPKLRKRRVHPRFDASCSVAALERARHTAEAAGARFTVVLAESPDKGFRRDRRRFAVALARRGIPFVSLDRLLAPGEKRKLRYVRDRHWNATGHRWVAELLAPEVARLLAAPPGGRGPGGG
jgi:hypothetical protein